MTEPARSAPANLSRRVERAIIVAMVIWYVVLAIGFSLGPVLEGHDEFAHYRYVQDVAANRGMLDFTEYPPGEYHQAPLYYVLAAPIIMLVDDSDASQGAGPINPFYLPLIAQEYANNVPGSDNKNFYVHSQVETFPYRENGTVREVHLIRLMSVLYGTGTVVVSYQVFRQVWPERSDRRLVALGFVAFLPNLLYGSGLVNNDSLLIFLSTVSLWLMLRQLRLGPSRGRAILLGVVLGAALLAKSSGLFLVFPVAVATRFDRQSLRSAALTLAVTLIVSGWLFVRNFLLYGDPTGIGALYDTVLPEHAIRNGQFVLSAGLRGLPQVYRRFWAQFGPHGQVVVLREFYTFFNVLAIATVLGLALRSVQVIRRNRSNQDQSASMLHAPLIGTFALVWVAFVIYFSGVDIFGNQGRYLYPGIAAWGALVALGLDNWTPRRLRLPVALSSVIVMATVATVSLFGYFLPAYRVRPAPAEIERPLAYRYEDAAELIGIEPAVTYAQPGEVVKINLYWRAIAPTKNSLYAYLHTAESDVVRRDSLPATGNLLSTEWEPGQTWAESYVVRIPLESDPQNRHRLIAGLYDPQLDLSLPAVNEDGNEVLPVVGWIVISGDTKQFEPEYRFDDTIGLGEPQITRLGENLEVCLDWLSLGRDDHSLPRIRACYGRR